MQSHQQLDEAISKTMARFGEDLRLILGDNLKSVILFGSAVLGDFTPGKGDLDFVVVTASAVTPEDCERIFALHDRMRSSESDVLSRQLEGTYYPLPIVIDPIRAKALGCYVGTGRKGWKPVDVSKNSLIDYAIIKQHGKTCYGDDVIHLIYNPSHEELVDEFRVGLRDSIRDAAHIGGYNYKLSMLHWAPRGLCMTLTGKLLSKRHAAEWFVSEYGNTKWSSAVALAGLHRYPLSEDEIGSIQPVVDADIPEFLQDVAQLAGIALDYDQGGIL